MTKKAKRRKIIVKVIEGIIGTLIVYGFIFAFAMIAESACRIAGVA